MTDPQITTNYGTVISGGTFTGNNIGGQGAVFDASGQGEELRRRVEALLALIEAHAGELPEARHARRDLEEVLTEVEAVPETRDPARVGAALDRLSTRLAPVTALVTALGPIAELVQSLL
ncbi:hypothetical protein [Nonomuraea typhae]|uniref:DUF4404 family protein n=1 Tax=Nonomuraea typhae TaxID=2603600 RepID=A0ABW7YS24_9ACTN